MKRTIILDGQLGQGGRNMANASWDIKKDPMYMEQVKALRAKIEHRMESHPVKVIAVTSAIAGEGKTALSVNLAANLASSGRRKGLLVDVDLRKSDVARGLKIPVQPGLGEFLSGSAALKDIVRNSLFPGLHVIPAGKRNFAPDDLLAGDKFRTFIDGVRTRFDFILLDTPPVIPIADTLTLKDRVDIFIFLFRARFTPYTMLKQAIADVGEEKILGVVLNGVESRSDRYYQRYYGKYYTKS